MSLDLHISVSQKAASRQRADLQLDLYSHAALFGRPLDGRSLMVRLSDFYSDAEFEIEELPLLRAELQNELNSSKSKLAMEALKGLCDVVDRAIAGNKKLFVFAD